MKPVPSYTACSLPVILQSASSITRMWQPSFLSVSAYETNIVQPMTNGCGKVPKSVMMTSSNANIFRVTGPLWGESTGHRWIPFTKASDGEFWYFLWSAPEKRLSKKLRHRWFETQSRSPWRHCNGGLFNSCELIITGMVLGECGFQPCLPVR